MHNPILLLFSVALVFWVYIFVFSLVIYFAQSFSIFSIFPLFSLLLSGGITWSRKQDEAAGKVSSVVDRFQDVTGAGLAWHVPVKGFPTFA